MRKSFMQSLVPISVYGFLALSLDGCGGFGNASSTQTSNFTPANSVQPSLVRRATVTETVLYSFCRLASCDDGANPSTPLTDVRGTLYGTTQGGGGVGCRGFGCGAVFKITTAGVETVLHGFGGGDGQYPEGGLTYVNGSTLYGTTQQGGAAGHGTVFKIKPTGASYATLHHFASGGDGEYPEGALTNVSGLLYGTTYGGGTHGSGTVYTITTAGVEMVFLSFKTKSEGQRPYAGLTDVNGVLYGTTWGGGGSECGKFGCGTVFKITTAGVKTVLHSFAGADGANPHANLIAVGSTLYGTTEDGGKHGSGTIFRIKTSGASYAVLHSFGSGSDGAYAYAPLINVNGTLYSTTLVGGTYHCGTVFEIKPSGASYSVIYNFAGGTDGCAPFAGLTDVTGVLYGTTSTGGGVYNSGTVFSLSGF